MSFKEGQAVCITSNKTGKVGHYLVLCVVDCRVVYSNNTGVYVRDVDDMVDRVDRNAHSEWLGLIEEDGPLPQVESTYGFYLFGKYKCRERGQWIPCQVAYNERTRQWSVDVHEGA